MGRRRYTPDAFTMTKRWRRLVTASFSCFRERSSEGMETVLAELQRSWQSRVKAHLRGRDGFPIMGRRRRRATASGERVPVHSLG